MRIISITCMRSPAADVRGTNPKLWNSWKASLFHDFYDRVKRALRRGLESPIDQDQLVRETQDAARRLLVERGVPEKDVERTWSRFSAAYFLQHSPEEVAWHARLLAERDQGSDEPLVALDPRSVRGTTAVLIFSRPRRYGFARTTAVLDQLGLNIVDARITPTGDGFSLDLYHVLEDDGAPIVDRDRRVRSSTRCGDRCSGRMTRRLRCRGARPGRPAVQYADPDCAQCR